MDTYAPGRKTDKEGKKRGEFSQSGVRVSFRN
jgi:hypothetical protein